MAAAVLTRALIPGAIIQIIGVFLRQRIGKPDQEEYMTVQEFLEALKEVRAVGYRPYLVSKPYGQTIRLRSPAGDEHCPITAVCERQTGQTFPPADVYSALESLGLSPDDAYSIATVADVPTIEPVLRQQILVALTLPEAE
jgi:hypothetical protein